MKVAALALTVLSLVGPAAAQEMRVPARLTLDDALRIAEERSPALRAARAATSLAEAGALGAGKRPNPVLSVESQGLPFSEDPRPPFFDDQELTITVEQDIELGGRRGLRERVARLDVAASGAEARDRLRHLRFEVRRVYMQAVLARADHQAAAATLSDIDRVLAINRARYEQGELSGVELRRLQVERHRFADDVMTADLALKNARSTLLAALSARPLDQTFDTADPLVAQAGEPVADVALRTQALSSRPDLEALQLKEGRARADAELQHALRTPVLMLGGGWQRDFGTNALVLRARMPLPFANRNEGGVAQADAVRRLAAAASEAAGTAADLEIQLAANSVAASRARVAYVEGEYLKNAREARDIVLASYRAGASTLIDYLDAQRALGEAQRVQNRALYDYRVSLFQLEGALGLPAAPAAAAK